MDQTTALSFQDGEQGRRVSSWCPAFSPAGTMKQRPRSSLLESRGEGDRDGETRPWREGSLWDCPYQEAQSATTRTSESVPHGGPRGLLWVYSIWRLQERSWLGWSPPLAQAGGGGAHAQARTRAGAEGRQRDRVWACMRASGRGRLARSVHTWLWVWVLVRAQYELWVWMWTRGSERGRGHVALSVGGGVLA